MLCLSANTRTIAWRTKDGRYGNFMPSGRRYFYNREFLESRPNPPRWESDETYAARLIVGFNVGGTPTWKVDDIIPIVVRVREEQGGKQGASFLYQKGIYRHHDSKQLVEEDSVQIVIIDVWGTPKSQFEQEMVRLGEILAKELEQDEVIVEFQKNGVTQKTMGVYA